MMPRTQLARPDVGDPGDRLPDDAFVMLDPAVEMLETTAEHRLLAHGHLDVGMVVPPGEGLLAFIDALAGRPVGVGVLRTRFDDQALIDTMLSALRRHGFLHATAEETPSASELARLRERADLVRRPNLRAIQTFDLDTGLSVEQLAADLGPARTAPEVLLRCARLDDHLEVLTALADLRETGAVRVQHIEVTTGRLSENAALSRSLNRLAAAVGLYDVTWPAPRRPPIGLAEMTRSCVAVYALMRPGLSVLDSDARAEAVGWATSAHLSGLRLTLEPDALWPDGNAGAPEFLAVFEAVRELEDQLGDVQVVNLPSDEVLLGNTATVPTDDRSPSTRRFRTAYVRWRLPLLKSCENDNSWSQVPEVEDKLVRADQDLLPTHPELLGIGRGSVVIDVCGGLGRVARRLSPAVGPDGLVVSLEMFRCLSDRARRFACDRGFTNVHFRTGLAERIPLPDATVDAAVNEWTGAIWELGVGPTMVGEMVRVVRTGGRVAVTHRLVQLGLESLGQPWVQYEEIYRWMSQAMAHPLLNIIAERVWGQVVPSLVGQKATDWRKQYMPRLVNPFELTYQSDERPGPNADVYLTIIAERL